VKVDEAREEDEHSATMAEMENQITAFTKPDRAEAVADARRSEDEEDGDAPFSVTQPCTPEKQFFCSILGPLARAQTGIPEPSQPMQRDVASQRIQLVSGRRERAA
jgi:hypothetical protein